MRIIGESLEDLDKVSQLLSGMAMRCADGSSWLIQVDEIPGEGDSEKGFKEVLDD